MGAVHIQTAVNVEDLWGQGARERLLHRLRDARSRRLWHGRGAAAAADQRLEPQKGTAVGPLFTCRQDCMNCTGHTQNAGPTNSEQRNRQHCSESINMRGTHQTEQAMMATRRRLLLSLAVSIRASSALSSRARAPASSDSFWEALRGGGGAGRRCCRCFAALVC